jgi:hypothetical protein
LSLQGFRISFAPAVADDGGLSGGVALLVRKCFSAFLFSRLSSRDGQILFVNVGG